MKSRPRGLAIDISSTVRRLSVSRARVREAAVAALEAERAKDAMLSITFVGRATISELNRRFLGHHGATDVISFGLGRAGKLGAGGLASSGESAARGDDLRCARFPRRRRPIPVAHPPSQRDTEAARVGGAGR